MPAEPGQLLSHYRLVEKVGEGGMGVVWKAEDTILRRTVAIKVLPSDAARDETRRRMFLKEARLASSISEAHIVQVHDFGREKDLDFIVMEYVEGKPLNRIIRGRPLPPERVADIGAQIAQALTRAHRKGLLHRDLKPGNILVTANGEVKIVDFGLATLLARPESTWDSEAPTRSVAEELPGEDSGKANRAVVGTLPYMSPEQIQGKKIDSRSDIFSVGVVLYEMTTGRRPFAGTTPREIAETIGKANPTPVHELRHRVPLDLDKIIHKALALQPGDRYQTVDDLAVDLKHLHRDLESGSSPSYAELKGETAPTEKKRGWGLVLTVVLVLLAIGLFGWQQGWWFSAPPFLDESKVMILPLEVRGQEKGANYVGRAFAEALAVNLAQAEGLEVLPVPTESLNGSEQRTADPVGTARDAGAGRVLTGSLAREGTAIHATVSLLDAAGNRLLWGTQRDGTDNQMASVTSHLAREIAAELKAPFPSLYDSPLNLTGGPAMSASPDTHAALGALRRVEIPAALDATEHLVRDFPREADAHVLRAYAFYLAYLNLDQSAANREALEESLANLALLDPRNPYGLALRGRIEVGEGRPRKEIDMLTQVLDRKDLTSEFRAHLLRRRATRHLRLGDQGAALEDLEESLELNPTNAYTLRTLSWALDEAGRPEEALDRARQAVAIEPESSVMYENLAATLRSVGLSEEAVAPARQACGMSRNQVTCAVSAIILLEAGSPTDAFEAAKDAAALPDVSNGAYNLACFFALAGKPHEAIRWLRQWLDLGGADMSIADDPDLATLKGIPEFENVVAEVKKRVER